MNLMKVNPIFKYTWMITIPKWCEKLGLAIPYFFKSPPALIYSNHIPIQAPIHTYKRGHRFEATSKRFDERCALIVHERENYEPNLYKLTFCCINNRNFAVSVELGDAGQKEKAYLSYFT